MELRRKHGFTLIELLVVIAIIGILAAMLFPVFARARESARKTQCLANVKNIAIAMNMYLTDYDKTPPAEHRADVMAWYDDPANCPGAWADRSSGNPFLEWPVILDDYTKNRDIWRCPSSAMQSKVGITNPGADPTGHNDWFEATKAYHDAGTDCAGADMCSQPYPPGWGGAVTDSALQHQCAVQSGVGANVQNGAFVMNYGLPDAREVATSEMEDSAKFLIVGDGHTNRMLWAATQIAYPDLCSVYCAKCSPNYGCYGDPAQVDSLPDCSATRHPEVVYDTQARKMYGRARHMGGSNVGFADGHAKWFASEAILSGCTDNRWFITDAQRNKDIIVSNVELCGPMNLPGGVQP